MFAPEGAKALKHTVFALYGRNLHLRHKPKTQLWTLVFKPKSVIRIHVGALFVCVDFLYISILFKAEK